MFKSLMIYSFLSSDNLQKGLSGNYLAWKSSTLSPPLLIEPALWFWLYQGYFLETFLEDWRRLVIFNWDYLTDYPCQIIVVCTVPPNLENQKAKIQFNSVVKLGFMRLSFKTRIKKIRSITCTPISQPIIYFGTGHIVYCLI